MEDSKALKNLINKDVVSLIGKEVKQVYPSFDLNHFLKASDKLGPLELKPRVLLLTSELKNLLPENYLKSLDILVKVIKRKKLSGFTLWPISEYISQFGLNHIEESMQAMYHLTQHFTSEFAIRPFLNSHPEKVLKQFSDWSEDKNHHVRRWVSEGSRPLLPWAMRIPHLVKDPTPTLLLLDKLKYDEELYVRKSVANHLNDISKHHPHLVISKLNEWLEDCPDIYIENINWIKRHALRTLIKKGHPDALKLMGVVGEAKVKIGEVKLNKKTFKLGDKLEFQFEVVSTSSKSQKLVIDYCIDFMKSNGKKGSKVFKLKTIELAGKEKVSVKKTHSLKPITTMVYYKGLHHLKIQVNGKIVQSIDWQFKI